MLLLAWVNTEVVLLVRKERDRLVLPGGIVNNTKELVAANPNKVVAMVDAARCRVVLIDGILCRYM